MKKLRLKTKAAEDLAKHFGVPTIVIIQADEAMIRHGFELYHNDRDDQFHLALPLSIPGVENKMILVDVCHYEQIEEASK